MAAVAFVGFDASELAAWLLRTRADYVEERMAAGDSRAEAARSADESLDRLFPGGAPAAGQLVGRVLLGEEVIGELWIGPYAEDPERWWVWNIEIDERFRGRGLGRRTMELAEELALRNGATSLGLNVFARNAVARGLYRSLGYEESAVQMRKSLRREAR